MLQKTASVIVVESLYVPSEHTHILLAALIHPKSRVDKAVFVFLSNHSLPNFKVRPLSPDRNVEADLLKMRRATNLSYFVGQPTSILSHDFRTSATKVAKRRGQGMSSQSEHNGC